jgi:hypothetical protein
MLTDTKTSSIGKGKQENRRKKIEKKEKEISGFASKEVLQK